MNEGVFALLGTWWKDDDARLDESGALPEIDVALDDLETDRSSPGGLPPDQSGVRIPGNAVIVQRATDPDDDGLPVRMESLLPAEDDWVAPRLEATTAPPDEAHAAAVATFRPSSPTPIIEARWIEVDEPLVDSEHARPTRRVRLARVLAATLARTGTDDESSG